MRVGARIALRADESASEPRYTGPSSNVAKERAPAEGGKTLAESGKRSAHKERYKLK